MESNFKRYPGELYPCVYKCNHEGCLYWYRNSKDNRKLQPKN